MMRRPKSRSAMALAEPRFDLGNLGELLRGQLALQSFDRLGKAFSVPAARDGVVGKTLGVREGLALGVLGVRVGGDCRHGGVMVAISASVKSRQASS